MNENTILAGKPIDAIGEMTWDERGSSVMCKIRYIDVKPQEVATLSEKLDRQFNIEMHNYILAGGFFSMALDPQKRIVDWSIYTNPGRWIRGERVFEEAEPATAHICTAFDESGRAYIGEPAEFYEPIRCAFYLSWTKSSIWYEIAPGMALGVTAGHYLAELRLDGLSIPDVERRGLWWRLRQLV